MIKIIDNLTSKANAKHIENCLITHPWYYLKDTAYNQHDDTKKPYEPSWMYFLYNKGDSLSDVKPLAESLLITALDKLNLPFKELIRIRAGLSTRTPYPVRHAPHVDYDSRHMSALYYVNDSDGDTIFYNEERDENLTISSYEWSKDKTFTVRQQVTPRADRMVIFNGLIYHSSSTPCNHDNRIVLNFNWMAY
jgi:hypothetical protein